MTLDYVSPVPGTTGAGLTKTSTQITGQTTVTTAAGLAIADVYTLTFTLDVGDTENPITAATNSVCCEFHLTNTTGVGAIHLVSGCFAYESIY